MNYFVSDYSQPSLVFNHEKSQYSDNIFTTPTPFNIETRSYGVYQSVDFYGEITTTDRDIEVFLNFTSWIYSKGRITPRRGLVLMFISPSKKEVFEQIINFNESLYSYKKKLSEVGFWKIHFEMYFGSTDLWTGNESWYGWERSSFTVTFTNFNSVSYTFDRTTGELFYYSVSDISDYYSLFFKSSEVISGKSNLYLKYLSNTNNSEVPVEKIEIYYPHGSLVYKLFVTTANLEINLPLPIFPSSFYKIVIYEKENAGTDHYSFFIARKESQKAIPFYLINSEPSPNYKMLFKEEFNNNYSSTWTEETWGQVKYNHNSFVDNEKVGTEGYSILHESIILASASGSRYRIMLGIKIVNYEKILFAFMLKKTAGETVFRVAVEDGNSNYLFMDFCRENKEEYHVYNGGDNVFVCEYPSGTISMGSWLAYSFNIKSVITKLKEKSWLTTDFIPKTISFIEIYQDKVSSDGNIVFYDNIYILSPSSDMSQMTTSTSTSIDTNTSATDNIQTISLLPQFSKVTTGYIYFSTLSTMLVVLILIRKKGIQKSEKYNRKRN